MVRGWVPEVLAPAPGDGRRRAAASALLVLAAALLVGAVRLPRLGALPGLGYRLLASVAGVAMCAAAAARTRRPPIAFRVPWWTTGLVQSMAIVGAFCIGMALVPSRLLAAAATGLLPAPTGGLLRFSRANTGAFAIGFAIILVGLIG